jgi:hypothetical protein
VADQSDAARMRARIAEVSGDLVGPDPRDFVRQGPPTATPHTYLGRSRIGGRGLFMRPGRWRHRLFLWSSALVAAVILELILAAIFGHTVVVIVISALVGLVIGSFGHTEADLRFRVTDRGINLGVLKSSFPWADVTRITLVTMPAEDMGPSGNLRRECPRCGGNGHRPVAGIEVYGTAGAPIAQVNMAYVAAPDLVHCLACHAKGRDITPGPNARRRVAPPVGLRFLVDGWQRFSELVTGAAPHVELTRHSLTSLDPP